MKSHRNILLVEDDPAMRDIILLVFNQYFHQGYQIYSAKNGFEALEIIRGENPELVILDILLPHMNGLQLIQKLYEEQLLKTTEIIVISGLGFKEVVQQAMNAGASDFLVKPFRTDALIERAKVILQRYEPQPV
jgi:DNA-binding response OmpR family regulator